MMFVIERCPKDPGSFQNYLFRSKTDEMNDGRKKIEKLSEELS